MNNKDPTNNFYIFTLIKEVTRPKKLDETKVTADETTFHKKLAYLFTVMETSPNTQSKYKRYSKATYLCV